MTKWAGTRDYNEFVECFRGHSTEDLLRHVKSDIYCIATIWRDFNVEDDFNWIVIFNTYITLKANLDVLVERGIDRYSTKLAAEGILARLESALDKRRTEGRKTRLARKLVKAKEKVA